MFRTLFLLSLSLLTITAAPAPLTPFTKPTNISQCLYPAGMNPSDATCFDNPNTPIKEFTLVLDTMQLPGFPRPLISINGSYPGPTIEVNQFDIVVVHIVNIMNEPTSVHFHGMRQYKSPHMDGVPGLTQCPIGPMSNFTYRFCADRSGTFWYHAHYNEHIVDGLYGSFLIRPQPYGEVYGPQYDIEIPMLMSDFYNTKGNVLLGPFLSPASLGFEPVPEQFVINGRFAGQTAWGIERTKKIRLRMINSGAFAMFTVSIDAIPMTVIEIDGTDVEPHVVTSFSISVAQRVSVLLDLSTIDPAITAINIHAVANPAMFDPDLITNGAVFDVTAAIFLCDSKQNTGVCAQPINTPVVPMQKPISLENNFQGYPNGQYNAALYQVQAPVATPDMPASDLNLLKTKPLYPAYVGSNSASCYRIYFSDITHVDAVVPMVLAFDNDPYEINRGQFNGLSYDNRSVWNNLYMQPLVAPQPLLYSTIQSSKAYTKILSDSTLQALSTPISPYDESMAITDPDILPDGLKGMYDDSWLSNKSESMNIITRNQLGQYILPANSTIEIVVINTDPGLHPIHFHGYAPWIISSSEYPEGEQDNYGNYPIRDVWNIPGGGGWVKLRITTDNPGVWILHCHISWHLEAGLAAVFIDNIDVLQNDPFFSNGTLIPEDHIDTCSNYDPPMPDALVNPCKVFVDNEGFNFALTAGTQTKWAMIADLIIISEAIFGWIIYKLGILNFILPELIGINIGTWIGVVFIEILKETFEQVFEAKTLEYRNVVIVMCIGFLFPFVMEKCIKRGRSNKFKFLMNNNTNNQDKDIEGKSTSAGPSLLHTARQPASSDADLVTPRLPKSSNADVPEKFVDDEKRQADTTTTDNVKVEMVNMEKRPSTVTFHTSDQVAQVTLDMAKASSPDVLSSKTDLVDPLETSSSPKHATTTSTDIKKEKRGSGMERIAQALASSQVDYTLIAIIVLGEMVDTFVDGGIIAAAFLAGNSVGISTTVGVFMEELPRLTGSFAVFVSAGAPAWKCMLINVLSSCAFLVGSGFIMGIASNPNVSAANIYYLLPYAAGSFLYVALVDLTPILTNMPWPGYPRAFTQIASVMFGIGLQAAIGVYQWKTKTS